VAENQPANKNRMITKLSTKLSNFAARLREAILSFPDAGDDVRRLILQNQQSAIGNQQLLEPPHPPSLRYDAASVGSYEKDFNRLALELFALQFKHNAAYRKICEARGLTPKVIEHWTQIPAVPTAAFKELELSCIPSAERTAVFHSSGTTEQKPSRHFHSAESLKLYEASLIPWFLENVLPDLRFTIYDLRLVCLTPLPTQAPHSSLVHMFETIRSRAGENADHSFFGTVAADSSWTLDFPAVIDALSFVCTSSRSSRGNEAHSSKSEIVRASFRLRPSTARQARRLLHFQQPARPILLLGTAFSFVHLLDYLVENKLSFRLPPGSRVMETGGYKNRSRSMPRTELHQLITKRLGVPLSHIICEYGMSELSSQAYDTKLEHRSPTRRDAVGVQALACLDGTLKRELQRAGSETGAPPCWCHFYFPPWARVQIISPETGREVADGETGLIRVFDLANVFSVMAIQTEDLGIRRGDGFELIGRAALAEARGCSLMTV
jgi:hypothetical protein